MKKHVPNAITCLNLFSGCVALYFAFNDQLVIASWLIALAAAFDFLDGMVARVLKTSSEIGKQLDSLADVVSFGVAPGAIMFMMLSKVGLPLFGLSAELVPFLGFIITVFSALRLAKFNIDTRQTSSFIGLPTPACSMVVASLPLILENGTLLHYEVIQNYFMLLPLTALLSYLLVAELPLIALKFQNLTWKDNAIRYIFLVLSVILLVLLNFAAVPLIVALYIVLSIIKKPHTHHEIYS